jgi:hypothetical protein
MIELLILIALAIIVLINKNNVDKDSYNLMICSLFILSGAFFIKNKYCKSSEGFAVAKKTVAKTPAKKTVAKTPAKKTAAKTPAKATPVKAKTPVTVVKSTMPTSTIVPEHHEEHHEEHHHKFSEEHPMPHYALQSETNSLAEQVHTLIQSGTVTSEGLNNLLKNNVVTSEDLASLHQVLNQQGLTLSQLGITVGKLQSQPAVTQASGPSTIPGGATTLFLTDSWQGNTDAQKTINGKSVWAGEISNDVGGFQQLMIVGNKSGGGPDRRVGVWDTLNVHGTLNADNSNLNGNVIVNGIKLSKGWTSYPDGRKDGSEISNDTSGFNELMVVGNKAGGGIDRRVGVWDTLNVHGTLNVEQAANIPNLGEKRCVATTNGQCGANQYLKNVTFDQTGKFTGGTCCGF